MDDDHSISKLKVSGYLIVIAFFSYIAISDFPQLYTVMTAKNWESTQADVKSSSISKLVENGRNGVFEGYSYQPTIKYRYKAVESEKYYDGSRTKLITTIKFPSEYEAQAFLDQKIKDNKITVYYDRANPEISVVSTELDYYQMAKPVGCAFFALIFSVGLYQNFRRASL